VVRRQQRESWQHFTSIVKQINQHISEGSNWLRRIHGGWVQRPGRVGEEAAEK
jgi:hypothetical protein